MARCPCVCENILSFLYQLSCSTCSVPQKSLLRYSLTCSQLAPGDVCISLTHTPRSTNTSTSREERRKGEEEEGGDHRADFALMPPPAEGRTSRGVGGGGGGGGGGEEQIREVGNLGTQRNQDLHVSQVTASSSPLKAIQAGGHAAGHLGQSGGGQHLGNSGGQEGQVSAPGRARSGP